MLYINACAVDRLTDIKEMLAVIEQGFLQYEQGGITMPDRVNIYDGNRIFAYMPCFTQQAKGTKVLTLYPDNKDRPPVQGVMLINNASHGGIDCIIHGASITANRTAAVGAVGVKYTTPQECHTLGVIGAGTQGFYQCLYTSAVRDIRAVCVLDADQARANAFKRKLDERLPGVKVYVAVNAEALLEASEIVITATTSRMPVLPDKAEILKGKHFIGIGSYRPDMREYPQALFSLLNTIYIDAEYAKEESGDIAIPVAEGWIAPQRIVRLGQAIASGRADARGTTFFKSVGMSYFDLCVGMYLFEKAKRLDMGQKMEE